VIAKLHSVERVDKWVCGVLCLRPVSVLWASLYNRIKQTVERTVSPEYWVYECRVSGSRNSCECFVLITDCFNCLNCSVSNCCYLLNPWASLLQYVCQQFWRYSPTMYWPDTAQQCIDPLSFNFSVSGYLKTLVCWAVIENEETLRQRIFDACQTICNCPRSF